MIIKLNLQRFAFFPEFPQVPGTSRPTTNTTSTIKIKFKDSFTLSTNVDVSINFVCSGIPYQRIQVSNNLLRYQDISGDWVTCCNEVGWTNYKYQIIEIDTTQASFSNFITAFKSNIEGVELEAGTYKWVDEPTIPTISFVAPFTFITTGSYDYIKISGDTSHIVYTDFDNDTTNAYTFSNKDWWNNTYKTITTTENQYVDYDFYNYAILAGNLVKQATEITYTCKWYLDGTLVNTSTFTHSQLTGVDYNVLGSVFKVMLSASVLAQYDYGVNLNGETSNASLGSDNVITIEAFKSNIVFNITSNGTTTLATKNTYVPCDIDFNVNVPSVQLQEKSEYITSNTETIITPDTGKALSKVTITTDVPQMTEVATSAEMDAKLKEDNVSLYYKYTGTTDDKYTNGDIYQVQEG